MKFTRKAQSLPLNTIVIAILVIVVMLVIIVFFTSQVGDTGDTLNQNSASQCSEDNPALRTIHSDLIERFGSSTFEAEGSDGRCPAGYNPMATLPDCCIIDNQ